MSSDQSQPPALIKGSLWLSSIGPFNRAKISFEKKEEKKGGQYKRGFVAVEKKIKHRGEINCKDEFNSLTLATVYKKKFFIFTKV